MKWGELQESFCGQSGLGASAKALSSGDLSCASGRGGGCFCSRIEGQAVGRPWQWARTEEDEVAKDEASDLGGGHQNGTEATLPGGSLAWPKPAWAGRRGRAVSRGVAEDTEAIAFLLIRVWGLGR